MSYHFFVGSTSTLLSFDVVCWKGVLNPLLFLLRVFLCWFLSKASFWLFGFTFCSTTCGRCLFTCDSPVVGGTL